MPTQKIKFRNENSITNKGLSPEQIALELERIEKRDGVLTPAVLVKESEAPEAPLHNFFTWDDDEAARKFREIQARVLIKSVVVEQTTTEGQTVTVALMHNATDDSGRQGYYSFVNIASNAQLFRSALSHLESHLGNVRKSIRELQQLQPSEQLSKLDEKAGEIEEIAADLV